MLSYGWLSKFNRFSRTHTACEWADYVLNVPLRIYKRILLKETPKAFKPFIANVSIAEIGLNIAIIIIRILNNKKNIF